MSVLKLPQLEVDSMLTAERIVASPTVYGVGRNDVIFQVCVDRVRLWQYDLWKGMLMRCFCEGYKAKHPAYRDATCCDEWLSFANFLEWCNKEVDYKGKPEGMCLDKDLIVRGNKTYSPSTCSFVPVAVNNLLLDRGNMRGKWPVGVRLHKRANRYIARLSCDGKDRHIGIYPTPEQAFAAYKVAKEAQIKAVALRHKDVLKPAVFESLIDWSIL